MRQLSRDEILDIASSLEDYHKIFFTFWEMSSISMLEEDHRIKTAAVRFSSGKPQLLINEFFWNLLNKREKLFVICHECLHVILNHGIRNGKAQFPQATHEDVNIAQDITINEMIVHFGFDRHDLRGWQKYCWIDTVFLTRASSIKKNEAFTYYLEELLKEPKPKGGDGASGGIGGRPQIFDSHPEEDDLDTESDTDKEEKEQLAIDLLQELSADELEDLMNVLDSGEGGGDLGSRMRSLLEKKAKITKVKFTHIIRKLKKTAIIESFKDRESFTHNDRRFEDLISNHDIILPGNRELSFPKKDRLLTVVFMDVSASCISFLKVFVEVSRAFMAEEKIFNTRMFTFDTSVREVKFGDRIGMGGGTHFDIIERKCLQLEAEKGGRYPDCVVIITDGEGNRVVPKAPTKWVWLLTKRNSTDLIPRESKKMLISQVTF